jgi:DNA polymerase IV
VVVSEWLVDCIHYRRLLSTNQPFHKPKGFPIPEVVSKVAAPGASAVPPAVNNSPTSLQLKPTKKALLETPTKSNAWSPLPPTSARLQEIREVTDVSKVLEEYDDDLTEAINQAKEAVDLPLDDSDEDLASQSTVATTRESAVVEETESESERPAKRLRKNSHETFTCMHKHDGVSKGGNPNSVMIEILEKLANYYDRIQDQWRTIAYRKAVSCLKKQTKLIVTKEEARQLPGIGERLAAKIEEIAWTKTLQRLENVENDPTDQTVQKFAQIYGVGYQQAARWVSAGYRTFKDLEENVKLTDNQKIGIAHYDDFLQRIPRDEVTRLGAIVRDEAHRLDPQLQVTIMGSYRRGAQNSGDIDLMITKPGVSMDVLRNLLLLSFIPRLTVAGFVTATLAATSHRDGSKWHGACALPNSKIWRRIDFLLVPWTERGAALIYFTGNDIFNRSIRLLASKKGMRLNQHGLYKNVIRRKNRLRITDGELVESEDERRIFELLGVPWRPPHHRIC